MKRWYSLSLQILIAFITICSGCSSDKIQNPNQGKPRLIISTDTLNFSSISLVDTLILSTDPPGKIDWTVSFKPPWISASLLSGSLNGGSSPIIVTVNPGNLFPGAYQSHIDFTGDPRGELSVICFLNVMNYSDARVEVDTIHLLTPDYSSGFYLHNIGNNTLQWSSSVSFERLGVIPFQGRITAGDSAFITVFIDKSRMPAALYHETITITSNSVRGSLTIPVVFEVPAFTGISLNPSALRFDFRIDSAYFTITNIGNIPVNWLSEGGANYLTISPVSGTVEINDTARVRLVVDRTGLATDTLTTEIHFICNDSFHDTLNVELWNFRSDIWWLDFEIFDVDYNRSSDLLTATCPFPYSLNSINLTTRSIANFELPRSPECVSIHPDGGFAVVGHNGSISLVDLSGLNPVRSIDLSAVADDIIFGPNNWVYVFPRIDQWTNIFCINLLDGSERMSNRLIWQGTRARLHPSGNYIYGLSRDIYPNDLEKYDIRRDTALVLYNSPYHGDYDLGREFWIAEDGTRIYTASGNTFTSSEARESDMFYRGHFDGMEEIRWASLSDAQNLVALLGPRQDATGIYDRVYIYSQNSLQLDQTILLPPQVKFEEFGWRRINLEGYYLFFDPTGRELRVVVSGVSPDGTVKWGIVTVPVAGG